MSDEVRRTSCLEGQEMKLKASFGRLLVLIVPLNLVGCIVLSSRPLSNEVNSTQDQRLIGTWENSDPFGGRVILHIGINKSCRNALEWAFVGFDDGGEILISRFLGFARPGKENILSVRWRDKPQGKARWLLFKYEMRGADMLQLFPLKHDAIVDAVRQKRLSGVTEQLPVGNAGSDIKKKDRFTSLVITDDEHTMINYIDSNSDTCFSRLATVYSKVRANGQLREWIGR